MMHSRSMRKMTRGRSDPGRKGDDEPDFEEA